MSGNHTPTPWSVEVEADYEDEQPKVYVCSTATECDLTVVATMGEALSIPLDRKKDDAYLIVTAVNSYASSQAEIERLRTALLISTQLLEEISVDAQKHDDMATWALSSVMATSLRRTLA
jgi:hypothetical protein